MLRTSFWAIVISCSFVSLSSAGVTHITSIANETNGLVEFRNFENPDKRGHNASVPRGKTVGIEQVDAWIPWADSQQDLDDGKYLRFKFKKTQKDGSTSERTIYVWQSKGSIRCSEALVHSPDTPAVPGVGQEDGRRKVVFKSDGTFEFFKTE